VHATGYWALMSNPFSQREMFIVPSNLPPESLLHRRAWSASSPGDQEELEERPFRHRVTKTLEQLLLRGWVCIYVPVRVWVRRWLAVLMPTAERLDVLIFLFFHCAITARSVSNLFFACDVALDASDSKAGLTNSIHIVLYSLLMHW